MIPFSLLTQVTLATSAAFASPGAVLQEGGTSSITVLAQEEDRVVIVVQNKAPDMATLRIADGLEVEDTRVPANSEHIHSYRLEQRSEIGRASCRERV